MKAKLRGFKRWLDLEYSSEDTITSYFYTVKEFDEDIDVDNFDTDHIMEWVLEAENWSNNTIRRHIYGLKAFAKYDGADVNWERVPTPKQEEHNYRSLSYEKIQKVFDSCESIKEKAIVRISYDLALRVGELTQIRHEHMDFESGEIELDRLKKGSDIRTELDDETLEVLRGYEDWLNGYKDRLREKGEEEINDLNINLTKNKGRLFPWSRNMISYIMRRISNRAGIKTTIHVLRHSRATHLSEKEGWKRSDVQQLLGHKQGETTSKYIKPESSRITDKKKKAQSPKVT